MHHLVDLASWLFLLGVTLALASVLPVVRERAPRLLFWGFLLAALSPLVAILGVTLSNG